MKKLLIATMLLVSTPALATTCKIVGISDGDTATCLTSSKNQIKWLNKVWRGLIVNI